MTTFGAHQSATGSRRVSREKRSTSGPQISCDSRKGLFLLSFSNHGAGPSTTSTIFKYNWIGFQRFPRIGSSTPKKRLRNHPFPLAKLHLSIVPICALLFPFVSKRGFEKWSTSGPQIRWLIFEHSEGRDPPPFPISNFSS